MSTFPPTTTVFNDGYIAETYEAYRRDPSSVDESWRQFFRTAESLTGITGGAGAGSDPALLRKTAGAAALTDAIRNYGHLAVQLDPLGSKPPGAVELTPEFHGITEQELADVPASALGYTQGTAADVVRTLRGIYCDKIGLEYVHLGEEEERLWFRRTIEEAAHTQPLTAEEKLGLLRRLTEVDGLERFLQRAYLGYKRFSIEGTDVLVPMLDEAIARAAHGGARRVVMGMAHRGRLNVLTHVMGMSYVEMFGEFEGRQGETSADSSTGDVKYHLGYEGERTVGDATIKLELAPNPSHLEVVNPVMSGMARAYRGWRAPINGRPGPRKGGTSGSCCRSASTATRRSPARGLCRRRSTSRGCAAIAWAARSTSS
jgi:2-oxoglutarate dehydrogenase E1 component